MQKEIHEWLRTLVPVFVMAGVFYVGQVQQLTLISQKVDTLTEVLKETNTKMETISEKVISNDKEVSLQTFVIKTMDERLKALEEEKKKKGH